VILLQRGTNAWGGIMRLLCGFQISVPRWVRTNSATTIRQWRNVIESYEACGACLAVRLRSSRKHLRAQYGQFRAHSWSRLAKSRKAALPV
jgi:hypothetical protein